MGEESHCGQDWEPPSSSGGPARVYPERYPEASLPQGGLEGRKVTSIRVVKSVPRFRSSERTSAFRGTFFRRTSQAEWNDWRWQLRNRISNIELLSRIVSLSEEEKSGISNRTGLPLSITPYYASLLEKDNPLQPLRRTVVPVSAEFLQSPGEAEDPLGEEHDSPVPGVVHRYPDRLLFLVTDMCSTYCRYCTRSRMVGNGKSATFGKDRWKEAIAYIERTPIHQRRASVRRRPADPMRRGSRVAPLSGACHTPRGDHPNRHQGAGGFAPAYYAGSHTHVEKISPTPDEHPLHAS